MSITREEFDALVTRVNALEAVTERTWSMIGHLDTAVRDVHDKLLQHDRRFDSIDRRFESLDRKLDEITDVMVTRTMFSDQFDSIDRSLAEISRHLGMTE